jgi:hypothetical protein
MEILHWYSVIWMGIMVFADCLILGKLQAGGKPEPYSLRTAFAGFLLTLPVFVYLILLF